MDYRLILHLHDNSCTFRRTDVNYKNLTLRYQLQIGSPQIVGGVHFYQDEFSFDRGVFNFENGVWEMGTAHVLAVF